MQPPNIDMLEIVPKGLILLANRLDYLFQKDIKIEMEKLCMVFNRICGCLIYLMASLYTSFSDHFS